MEQNLLALLKTLCPSAFFDVAPAGTPGPFVTCHFIGGKSMRALDGDHCGERNSFIQINVWARTRMASMTLIRAIEDALIASTAFQVARPDGEPISDYDDDTELYGSIQRFSIWATR